MPHTSNTPSIDVTIGRMTRLYHAFITTAPATLDAPSTLTLYAGPFSDIVGFTSEPPKIGGARVTPSRLILIDGVELAWQRTRCGRRAHTLAPTDPDLLGLNTLQHWLWQRLQSASWPTHSEENDTELPQSEG